MVKGDPFISHLKIVLISINSLRIELKEINKNSALVNYSNVINWFSYILLSFC